MRTIKAELEEFKNHMKSCDEPELTKKEIRLFLSGICSGLALVGDPIEASLYFDEIEAMLKELRKEVH